MLTKLRRIEGLMRSRNRNAEDVTYDAIDMQKDLRKEFDELHDNNDVIKEKIRKLRVIQRGLAAGPALAKKPDKYAHVQGKLEVTHNKVTRAYQNTIEDLRSQCVVN